MDTSHLGSGIDDDIRCDARHHVYHSRAISEIELVRAKSDDVVKTSSLESSPNGRTRETSMSSDIDGVAGRELACHWIALFFVSLGAHPIDKVPGALWREF